MYGVGGWVGGNGGPVRGVGAAASNGGCCGSDGLMYEVGVWVQVLLLTHDVLGIKTGQK